MARSCWGLGAIALLFVAVVLNVTSFILPQWSTTEVFGDSVLDQVLEVNLHSGIWGFCVDVDASLGNSDDVFGSCVAYHSKSAHNNGSVLFTMLGNRSACDVLHSSPASVFLVSAETILPGGAKWASKYLSFMQRSCAGAGWVPLVFGAASIVSGLTAFAFTLFGVYFHKTKSRFNVATLAIIAFATVANLITFATWLHQAQALNASRSTKLGPSFILNVVSAVHFLASGGLLVQHTRLNPTTRQTPELTKAAHVAP